MRLALSLSLILAGCGAAVVTGETARVAACVETEDAILDRAEAGEMSPDEAAERVHVVRDLCDLMALKLREAGGMAEPEQE